MRLVVIWHGISHSKPTQHGILHNCCLLLGYDLAYFQNASLGAWNSIKDSAMCVPNSAVVQLHDFYYWNSTREALNSQAYTFTRLGWKVRWDWNCYITQSQGSWWCDVLADSQNKTENWSLSCGLFPSKLLKFCRVLRGLSRRVVTARIFCFLQVLVPMGKYLMVLICKCLMLLVQIYFISRHLKSQKLPQNTKNQRWDKYMTCACLKRRAILEILHFVVYLSFQYWDRSSSM